MGADIHLAVEAKTDGRWERVEPYRIETESRYVRRGDDWVRSGARIYEPRRVEAPGGRRSYQTFAILADVRQRSPIRWYGYYDIESMIRDEIVGEERIKALAAVRQDMFVPIAPPRGVPDDASEETRAEALGSSDWHTHSYFTLRELLAYDWNRQARFVEKVPREIEARARAVGAMEAWGEAYTSMPEDELRALYNRDDWVEVETWTPYHRCASEFYDELIPYLQALVVDGRTEDDVRVILWFDN